MFAIDPGNVYSAFCIMSDTFELGRFAKLENDEVMKIMIEELDNVDRVVIERIQSFGLAVGETVFRTCEWIGRFTQEALRKVPVDYVYRKDEKLYICGDPKAKDANIRQALIDRFATKDKVRGRGTKKDPDYFYGVANDVWSAISVSVTYYDMRTKYLIKEKKDV